MSSELPAVVVASLVPLSAMVAVLNATVHVESQYPFDDEARATPVKFVEFITLVTLATRVTPVTPIIGARHARRGKADAPSDPRAFVGHARDH